ncbi:MAG: discoidin domain-containing protein [Candidatus Binatia bacterium]
MPRSPRHCSSSSRRLSASSTFTGSSHGSRRRIPHGLLPPDDQRRPALRALYRTDYFGWPTASGRSLLCWLAVGVVLATCLRQAVRGRRGRRAALALAVGAAALLVGVPLTRALREAVSGRPLVLASSTLDGYSAAAVLEGRGDLTQAAPAGGWYSARPPGPEAPETLVFAFPQATSISRIELAAYPDPRFTLTSFVFQAAAADGWRDIDASRVTDNTAATTWRFTVPPVEARLIRLRIDGAADAVARVIAVRFSDVAAADPVSPP